MKGIHDASAKFSRLPPQLLLSYLKKRIDSGNGEGDNYFKNSFKDALQDLLLLSRKKIDDDISFIVVVFLRGSEEKKWENWCNEMIGKADEEKAWAEKPTPFKKREINPVDNYNENLIIKSKDVEENVFNKELDDEFSLDNI